MELPDDVSAILNRIDTLQFDKEKNKVRCTLTGHEMRPEAKIVEQYVSGKKFQRLLEQHEFRSKCQEYKDLIVPSNKAHMANMMFCKLTLRHINKDPEHMEQHINGKRFQKALARWRECQRTGQVFKPRGHLEAKPSMDVEDQALENEADDLADLYPEEDFVNPQQHYADYLGVGEDDFMDLSEEDDAAAPAAGSGAQDRKRRMNPAAGPSQKKPKKPKKKNKPKTT